MIQSLSKYTIHPMQAFQRAIILAENLIRAADNGFNADCIISHIYHSV